MGARGPKPGFKRAAKVQEQETAPALAASPSEPPAQPLQSEPQPEPVLSAADRENPNKLSGQALRELAHRRGIAKSLLPSMSDEKIRAELRYIIHRQYDDAVA